MTRAEQMRQYKSEGHTAKEVANLFGVSTDYVRKICKGIAPQSNKNSEADAARKISEKSNGLLEYVSGYTLKEKPVRVRCTVCGGEFERTFHNITSKKRVTCPYCVERERGNSRKAKDAELQRQKMKRELQAEIRKAEKELRSIAWKNRLYHECTVCGTLTQNPKYCCIACRNRAYNSQHEHKRRAVIKAQMVDKDITVEGLYRRDNGVCGICGRKCKWDDYTIKMGNKIAGDWYPSIDHIIPLKHGGLHSWDNVQLAHRRCNYLKSDKIDCE